MRCAAGLPESDCMRTSDTAPGNCASMVSLVCHAYDVMPHWPNTVGVRGCAAPRASIPPASSVGTQWEGRLTAGRDSRAREGEPPGGSPLSRGPAPALGMRMRMHMRTHRRRGCR